MKKIFTLILALMATVTPMLAQESDDKSSSTTQEPSWIRPLHLEASLNISTPYKGNLPFGSALELNYKVRRFSIHALFEGSYFLPKESITKDYNKTCNLGGGVGFELFPADENDRNVFEVRASVTRSIGSADYRNTAYKVGLQWLVSPRKRGLAPTVGVGYCFRDFSVKDLNSYSGMYVSLGIRF